MSELIILSTPRSKYMSDIIITRLTEMNHFNIRQLEIFHSIYPGGERYYRLNVSGPFDLIGKTAIYVCSIVDDEDILEVTRIGSTLIQYGVKRRIFIIPYLAYSTMERAILPGEVVTGKCLIQMLSAIESVGNENVFLLFDLHTAGLLHYFEGPCLRIELYGQKVLMSALQKLGFDKSTFLFASADLGRAAWVNAFARDTETGVAFMRRIKTINADRSERDEMELVGSVKGFHVVIYDDMIRTGATIISSADKYYEEGAISVDALISHFAPVDDNVIQSLINSKIRKFVITNTHPMSQALLVKGSDKFIVVDTSVEFVRCLGEILPKK